MSFTEKHIPIALDSQLSIETTSHFNQSFTQRAKAQRMKTINRKRLIIKSINEKQQTLKDIAEILELTQKQTRRFLIQNNFKIDNNIITR